MNSISPDNKIKSYQDLQIERERIEDMIKVQKLRIRHDIDELKIEAKREFKPVSDAADFVKKLTNPATRNDTLLGIGTSLTIEVLIRRLFAKSGFITQLVLPPLLKNYSTHMLNNMIRNMALRRQLNGHTNGTVISQKSTDNL